MRFPAKDRREQLLDVAMRLFSRQGFDGTTTRQIAQAADVNEAIIFRHFTSKENLYRAVVASRIGAVGRKRKLQEHLGNGRDEEGVLAGIAESLLDRTREDAALTRLLLFSALRNGERSDSLFRPYMTEAYDFLSDYFRKGVKDGRFRKINPGIAARGFLGMISNHILVQELFGGGGGQEFDPRALGQQLADIWLNGVSARPNAAQAHEGPMGTGKERRTAGERRSIQSKILDHSCDPTTQHGA